MSSNELITRVEATPLEVRLNTALYPRFASIEKATAIRVLLTIMQNAAFAAGKDVQDGAFNVMAELLYQQILTTYPRITMVEVARGINKGIFGLTGEFYGFNAAALFKMITAYVESEEITEALREEENARKKKEADNVEEISKFLERFSDYAKAIAHKD